MSIDLIERLRKANIQPSAQRLAVAQYVLHTQEHPSADVVLERVRVDFPMVSRATVYNTLHAFVKAGLLRELVLSEGKSVFDPHLAPHHHFIDDATGEIEDVPWGSISVGKPTHLKNYEVREYMVVLRGRKLKLSATSAQKKLRKKS
jgi:Fur family transcriptional regulator, iron response regulator